LQKTNFLRSSLTVIEHRGMKRTENKSNSVRMCSNLSTPFMGQIIIAALPLYDFCSSKNDSLL